MLNLYNKENFSNYFSGTVSFDNNDFDISVNKLDPITIESDKTLSEALQIMEKYNISGIPVVDDGKLSGILTNRDIRFESNLSLTVSDRMTTENLVTVPEGTTLEEAKKVLQEN